MRCVLAVFLVLAAAAPAFGRELMTTAETSVLAKPKKNAAVLTKLAQNVRITSDKRKDNWFRVSVEVDGKTISGWVHRHNVTDLMGRSKGQLLAENKRLYEEVVKLRETLKELRAQLAKGKQENDKLDAALKEATAQLEKWKAAAAELEKLRAAQKGAKK